MLPQEFDEFGNYLVALWPKLDLTPEQRDIWRRKFQGVTLFDARTAASKAYQTSKFAQPRPADVFDALRKVRQENVKTADDFAPEFIAQVRREESEEAEAIADWMDEQRESGRAEIIKREGGMDVILAKCPVRGPMLTHFLVERFIHHRATVFPKGAAPIQISTEEYWKETQA